MKKVAGVVLAIGVIASTGTIFANTDSGAYLYNWYNSSLQKQGDTIVASSSEEMDKGLESFRNFVSETKFGVNSIFNELGEKSFKETKSEIDNHQNHYQEQLQKTKLKLESENLDEYSNGIQTREVQNIDDDVEEILVEILGE